MKFHLHTHKAPAYYWVTIVSRNGRVVYTSETYTRKASAVASAWSLVRALSGADGLGKSDADGLPIIPKKGK